MSSITRFSPKSPVTPPLKFSKIRRSNPNHAKRKLDLSDSNSTETNENSIPNFDSPLNSKTHSLVLRLLSSSPTPSMAPSKTFNLLSDRLDRYLDESITNKKRRLNSLNPNPLRHPSSKASDFLLDRYTNQTSPASTTNPFSYISSLNSQNPHSFFPVPLPNFDDNDISDPVLNNKISDKDLFENFPGSENLNTSTKMDLKKHIYNMTEPGRNELGLKRENPLNQPTRPSNSLNKLHKGFSREHFIIPEDLQTQGWRKKEGKGQFKNLWSNASHPNEICLTFRDTNNKGRPLSAMELYTYMENALNQYKALKEDVSCVNILNADTAIENGYFKVEFLKQSLGDKIKQLLIDNSFQQISQEELKQSPEAQQILTTLKNAFTKSIENRVNSDLNFGNFRIKPNGEEFEVVLTDFREIDEDDEFLAAKSSELKNIKKDLGLLFAKEVLDQCFQEIESLILLSDSY